jgi:hypothetical protein
MLNGFGAVSYRYSLSLGVRMKKMFLPSISLVVFGISFLQAQPSRLDSVITKFQNDERSFEEFILLGRMECYSNAIGFEMIRINNWTDFASSLYAHLYNSLNPFTRLFKKDSIKKSLEEYFLLNKKHFEKYNSKEWLSDEKNLHYYNEIKLCDSLFDKNKDYRKQYLKLVNDKKNYLTPTNDMGSFDWEEIEVFRKDYLERYFIKSIIE